MTGDFSIFYFIYLYFSSGLFLICFTDAGSNTTKFTIQRHFYLDTCWKWIRSVVSKLAHKNYLKHLLKIPISRPPAIYVRNITLQFLLSKDLLGQFSVSQFTFTGIVLKVVSSDEIWAYFSRPIAKHSDLTALRRGLNIGIFTTPLILRSSQSWAPLTVFL